MKVLLLGDYSNVHATLAEGLRALGHYVVVASDGDGWKNYPRDIDLRRPGTPGEAGLRQRVLDASYLLRLKRLFVTRFRGFDVVQLVNPVFLPLRAERIMPFYQELRHHNRRVFMGAFGMDHYWVRAGLDCTTFRYSDFNIGSNVRHDLPENALFVRDWLEGPKGELNKMIAADCDGIPAGLYEYWAAYSHYLPAEHQHKLAYIPFPIHVEQVVEEPSEIVQDRPIRFFIGIQRARSAYKGTDIMCRALQRVKELYPKEVEILRVENVPFDEYKRLLNSSDVILDQLYSYTPAMNALQAMSQRVIVVGGAEPEYYALQLGKTGVGEQLSNYDTSDVATQEHPIVNVLPSESDVVEKLAWIVQHRHLVPALREASRTFVCRHHDHIKVARQYLEFWKS